MNRLKIIMAWLGVLGLASGTARAQPIEPPPLRPGVLRTFTMPPGAPEAAAGLRRQCHLLAIEAPLQGTIVLSAPGRSALSLADGGSCAAAQIRHRRQAETAKTSPVLPFDALGAGLYPIIVEVAAGERYGIMFNGLNERQRELRAAGGWRPVATLGTPGSTLTLPATTSTGLATAAPSDAQRIALMRQQIAVFEAYRGRIRDENAELRRRDTIERQRAAAEEAAERAEIARAKAADRADGAAAIANAIGYAGNRIATGLQEAAQIREDFQDRQREAQRIAELRTRAQRQVERQQTASNQTANLPPRREEAAATSAAAGPASEQAQAATPSAVSPRRPTATPVTVPVLPGTAAGPDARIAMLEAVVVCPPVAEGRVPLCYGPFQNSAGPDDPARMQLACGNRDASISDFGTVNGHRVWGCGFGINPMREGRSPNIDQARRFGLVIASRRTYRCASSIAGYCREV